VGTEAEVVISYRHIHLVVSDKQHSPLYPATIPFMRCVLPSVLLQANANDTHKPQSVILCLSLSR
jgi:hypothetical protein